MIGAGSRFQTFAPFGRIVITGDPATAGLTARPNSRDAIPDFSGTGIRPSLGLIWNSLPGPGPGSCRRCYPSPTGRVANSGVDGR